MENETTPSTQDAPVAEITEEQVNVEPDMDQNQNNNNGTEAEPEAESAMDQPETEAAIGGEGGVTDTPQTTETTHGESEQVTIEPADGNKGGDQHPGDVEAPTVGQEEASAPTDEASTENQPGEGQGSEDTGEGGALAEDEAEVTQQTESGEQEAKEQHGAEEGAEQQSVLVDMAGQEAEQEAGVIEGQEATGTEGQEAEPTPADEETPGELQASAVQGEDGERAESPIAVGVKLSREGSPVLMIDPDQMPEMLEPGTPDASDAGDADLSQQEMLEMDEEEADEPEFDREQLIERYHSAIQERDQLQQQNYQLQHKIAEYFRKKKSDDSRQDFDKNVSDQEQRYIKYMANLEELRKQEGQEQENYRVQIEELKERCGEKQERVEGERQRFIDFKKQVAVNSLNSRSGKCIPPKDIEQYLSTENRKDNDVVNVRLENIKLKNKLKKKEQQLKSKEELAEGLHLIDFEQLKIENQTYNEKIEERNEELLKLRKKITSTVQVLTHLKEKLQFVQAENHVQNSRLKEVEAVAAQKRDVLSRTKQARDALRIDNQKLRQNCGLLGNESLLRDFEDQRNESDELKMKLERLRMQHAELTLNCTQVRRKIEQVRLSQV